MKLREAPKKYPNTVKKGSGIIPFIQKIKRKSEILTIKPKKTKKSTPEDFFDHLQKKNIKK